MDGLRAETRKLVDDKYGPLIKEAVKRCTSVEEVAAEIQLPTVTTWRLMLRLGYRKTQGWRKGK